MRKVTCADCGKRYDYDKDDFCPKCGSFNQPPDSGATRLEQELLSRFPSGQARQSAGRNISGPAAKSRSAPAAHTPPRRGGSGPLTPSPRKKSGGGAVAGIVALLFCLLVILPLVVKFLGGLLRTFLFMFT